jgi:hypothetical protein
MHRLRELRRRAHAGRPADSGEDEMEAAVREEARA